jgi:hypothetical protein
MGAYNFRTLYQKSLRFRMVRAFMEVTRVSALGLRQKIRVLELWQVLR